MSKRFHTDVPLAPGLVALGKDETQHLLVSRVKAGDEVVLFGGDGVDYPGRIVDISRHGCSLLLGEPVSTHLETPAPVVVVAPLPKGDREQFLIEKLTEVGVSQFIPLKSERSVIHPEPKRLERLRRHVIEASKQCGRSRLMEIGEMVSLEKLVELFPPERAALWFGHVPEEREAGWSLPPALNPSSPLVAVVGPEGGFDPAEVKVMLQAGWRPCGLGRRKLRIETAALFLACEAVRMMENPA